MPVSAHLPALRPRPRGWLRALGLAGLAALCASRLPGADAAPGTAVALASDGQLLSGAASVATGTLSIGAASTTIDRIIDCHFGASRLHWLDQGVILADGQVLRGAVHEFQNGELAFACDLLGEQKIPATTLGAIVLSPVNAGRPLEAASASPGVVLANGEHIAGQVSFVDQNAVGITVGKRVRTIPRDRIRLVILRSCVPQSGTWVQLTSGDRLCATVTALGDDGVTLGTSFGTVHLPITGLAGLWSETPGLQPLDRLPAVASRIPSFDEDFAASQGEEPLAAITLAGAGAPPDSPVDEVRRGIVMPVGTTLTWAALGGAASLIGLVGPGPGTDTVVCAVLLDGKEVFSSGPMPPGTAPRLVHVPLTGATALALQVRHSDPTALGGGSAIWSWPTLVK